MNARTCHHTRVSFELYLDGTLSEEECEALENHLLECSSCASAIGDDVLLAQSVDETLRDAGGTLPPSAARPWSWRPLQAAAAAVLLLLAGIGIGHLTPRGSKPEASKPGVAAPAGPETAQAGVLPPSELSDDPWVGLASFTDADLAAAEREGQKSRRERTEWRWRRSEAELDLVRPLLEETATPDRVVARLRERIHAGVGAQGRPRADGDRATDPFLPVYGAAMLLRRDPSAALGPISEWLRVAETPRERRAAVKLLAMLRIPEAHDVLVTEVHGDARDAALGGLVALRDPRSRELFESVMDDKTLPLETTRVAAAGGLHRLGDPRGLAFLLKTFRAHRKPGPEAKPGQEQPLLKRILFNVGANPCHETVAVLPELIDGVVLSPKERSALVEWLTLSGMSETDPALIELVESAGDRRI